MQEFEQFMFFRGLTPQPGIFLTCLLGLALAFCPCYGDVLVAKGAGASTLSSGDVMAMKPRL